jgi:hypothetical protein
VIQKLRCNCQLKCQQAPLSDKTANPPYAIHNFGWKEGITNNDEKRDKMTEGNLTAHLDTKGISVTACTHCAACHSMFRKAAVAQSHV